MQHTPYGYDIIDGKAVANEEKAAILHEICENYLSGMSFVVAAADAGLTMSHCGFKRMLQNRKLLGDSFYPAIFTEETARQIEEERLRREKALGRDYRVCQKVKKPMIHTEFILPRIPQKYRDPVKQAEFAYSLIRSEVIG